MNSEKQTIKELMDDSVPSWNYDSVVKAFLQNGVTISISTIQRHRNGEEPNLTHRNCYCKIFSRTEEEIQWQKN